MIRGVQLGLVAAGALLLVLLIRAIGLAEVTSALGTFGIGFAIVLALELVLDGCYTRAWLAILPPPVAPGFWRLYWVRQAGTAVNQLTPTATLGGELVKAMLLKSHVATSPVVASLVAAKLSFAIGQAVLVVLGLGVVLARLRDAPALATAIVGGFALTLAGVLGFLVLQRRGLFATLARAAERLGWRTPLAARLHAAAVHLDRQLDALYRERPRAFVRSIAWHVAGQLVGLLQLLYIVTRLGVPVTVATALAIEACAIVVDSALFFVPARLGVHEGGRVLVFSALGLTAATGLTVALIVRVNQLVLAVIGLAAFAYFSFINTAVAPSIPEA